MHLIPADMRTCGMIGGLGPESTIDYYRSIIARFRARKPNAGHPHLIINSLDIDKGSAILIGIMKITIGSESV
jgi:aspartate/glutamate racemase